MNIAKDCIRKGKGWVRMNRRSKRLEFRYIEESDGHETGTEWANTEIERKQPVARESGKGVGALSSRAPVAPAGAPQQSLADTPTPVKPPTKVPAELGSAGAAVQELAPQAHPASVPRPPPTLKRGRSAAKAGGKATAKTGAKAKAKKGAQKELHELTPDEKVERAIVLYSEANI